MTKGTMEKLKSVIEERILNAVHKSLQWKDGEITGIDMSQLEQKVNGILALFKFSEPPSEPVGGVKGAEEIAQKWVDDGEWGYPNEDDKSGIWMANKLKEAFLAGWNASQFQQPQVDEKQVYNSAIDEAREALRKRGFIDADYNGKIVNEELSKLKKP